MDRWRSTLKRGEWPLKDQTNGEVAVTLSHCKYILRSFWLLTLKALRRRRRRKQIYLKHLRADRPFQQPLLAPSTVCSVDFALRNLAVALSGPVVRSILPVDNCRTGRFRTVQGTNSFGMASKTVAKDIITLRGSAAIVSEFFGSSPSLRLISRFVRCVCWNLVIDFVGLRLVFRFQVMLRTGKEMDSGVLYMIPFCSL